MKPGLIVTDLDGTLLDKRGRVSPRNRAALQAARAAGWHVAIATGRTWAESHHAIDCVAEDAYFIGAGGASLHEAGSGRVLSRHTIDAALTVQLAACIVEEGHRAHLLLDPSVAPHDYLFVGTARLDPATEWWLTEHPVRSHAWQSIPEDAPTHLEDRVLRVSAIGAEDELSGLAARIGGSFGERLTMRQWSALTPEEAARSAPRTHMLEIFTQGVDKWTMSVEIAARLGLRPAEIVALGDGLNDLTMMTHAGCAIAMGNADPRIAAVAHEHTADHDADGVALAIERILSRTLAP